ncbi:MAG: hypothetical protein R8K49_03390 [Mariprofundaceae bacterium]
MKHWQQWSCPIALTLNLTLLAATTSHAYECGLSCCVAAGVDGLCSSEGFNVTAQYEYMQMKTLKQGNLKPTTTAVIQNNLAGKAMGSMYLVPAKIVMQKL